MNLEYFSTLLHLCGNYKSMLENMKTSVLKKNLASQNRYQLNEMKITKIFIPAIFIKIRFKLKPLKVFGLVSRPLRHELALK